MRQHGNFIPVWALSKVLHFLPCRNQGAVGIYRPSLEKMSLIHPHLHLICAGNSQSNSISGNPKHEQQETVCSVLKTLTKGFKGLWISVFPWSECRVKTAAPLQKAVFKGLFANVSSETADGESKHLIKAHDSYVNTSSCLG